MHDTAQIGYWRYISIYRHLQRNPDNQLYPLFEYFENWCQDENRHGDFFSAILKSQPQVCTLMHLFIRSFTYEKGPTPKRDYILFAPYQPCVSPEQPVLYRTAGSSLVIVGCELACHSRRFSALSAT